MKTVRRPLLRTTSGALASGTARLNAPFDLSQSILEIYL
jgi:hypothetical protein